MAQNHNLTRGHKEYDSKIKNLKGIFEKVERIFDVSKYKDALSQIQNEVNNDPDLSKEMPTSEMLMDYECYTLAPYIKKLDDLTEKIEEELIPFYELHLLSSKIDIQISEVSADNIGQIIRDSRILIDLLNSLNTHNNKEKNSLIEKAYKTIYSVIIHEELFEVSDILSYINHLNIPTNKENIGRLVSNDLKKINEKDLIDENLRTIKTEGLGHDYLNPDFIRKISRNTVGEGNSEYQERKRRAVSEISTKVNSFNEEKNRLIKIMTSDNKKIKEFHINKAILTTKMLSFALIPIFTIGGSYMLGKNMSNKITEYKTITRTVDFESGKVIGDIDEVYDENETTYVATVMVYGPWHKNPAGVGYVRDVTAYEYIAPDNVDEGYHVTSEDLEKNVVEKYSYVEPKDTLETGDSTTDSTILITETYQDKNDNRKSKKFVIPFSFAGAGIGIAIDVVLLYFGIYDLRKIKCKFEKLNDNIKKYKLNSQEIEDRLKNMKEEALLLQNEYNNVVKKYGSWEEQNNLSDIDTSWLEDKPKILTKK